VSLGNPANRNEQVPLTYDQFRYAFSNAVTEDEAKQLYENYRATGGCHRPSTSNSKTTQASPRLSRSRIVDMPSPSTES
jgi:hypothetical protein